MAKRKMKWDEDSGEMQEVSRLVETPQGMMTEYQLDDGTWGDRQAAYQSRQNVDTGETRYFVDDPGVDSEGITGGNAGKMRVPSGYNSLQSTLLRKYIPDLGYMTPGTVISPQEFLNFYADMQAPGYLKQAPGSMEEYLNDPRAAIRREGENLVWRPDQAQGDWESAIGGNVGILNAAKGWLGAPGTSLVLAPFTGGTGVGANLSRVAGTMAQAEGNKTLGALGTLLSMGNLGDTLSKGWDAVTNFDPSSFDLSSLNPFGGGGEGNVFDGEFTVDYSPSEPYTNSFIDYVPTDGAVFDDYSGLGMNSVLGDNFSGLDFGNFIGDTTGAGAGAMYDVPGGESGGSLMGAAGIAGTGAAAAGAGSWIDSLIKDASKLFPGGLDSLLKGGSTFAGGLLNYDAANKNLDFAKQMYADSQGIRDYTNELYTNPLGVMDRELGGALQRSWDIGMRKGSAKGGNPMRNPAVMQQILQETQDSLSTPYLLNNRQIGMKAFVNPGDILSSVTNSNTARAGGIGSAVGGLVYPFLSQTATPKP